MTTDTSKYKFNHTMLRVKDPQESLKFYSFLGLSLINKLPNPDANFDLYFLAYDSPSALSPGKHWTDREGVIELTHNYGTESNPDYKIVNGNTEPYRGFGHICVSVDNIQAACARLEDAGYRFQKKLKDGRMRHIAFALDPDGYWVEIVSFNDVEKTAAETTTALESYRMNHTMIRVKDATVSLAFYQNIMGMTLLRTSENPANKFNLYFLGYPSTSTASAPAVSAADATAKPNLGTAHREGLLELTWNYGTEDDPTFAYHNGNAEPQGFGHICVSVDDLDAACARFEEHTEEKGGKLRWKKRLTDGRMRDVAFVLDPDGYWIEVIQNEGLKKRATW